MHNVLRGLVRVQAGKNPEPTIGIVDSQTVKSSPQAIDHVGYDGGKKIKGRKRHLIVDSLGMIMPDAPAGPLA